MERKIITREQAREMGLKRYFTGEACKRNHVAERFTINSGCVDCTNWAPIKGPPADDPYTMVMRIRPSPMKDPLPPTEGERLAMQHALDRVSSELLHVVREMQAIGYTAEEAGGLLLQCDKPIVQVVVSMPTIRGQYVPPRAGVNHAAMNCRPNPAPPVPTAPAPVVQQPGVDPITKLPTHDEDGNPIERSNPYM